MSEPKRPTDCRFDCRLVYVHVDDGEESAFDIESVRPPNSGTASEQIEKTVQQKPDEGPT